MKPAKLVHDPVFGSLLVAQWEGLETKEVEIVRKMCNTLWKDLVWPEWYTDESVKISFRGGTIEQYKCIIEKINARLLSLGEIEFILKEAEETIATNEDFSHTPHPGRLGWIRRFLGQISPERRESR